MEQSSHLSRYRPAVLAFTSVAAAYGVYVLYNTLTDRPPKNALRRSNAIHRPRPERPAQAHVTMMGYKPPDDEAFFGTLVLRNSLTANTLESDLANVGIPAMDELELFVGDIPNPTSFAREYHITAVQCILDAALLASTPERRQKFAERDLSSLPAIVEAQDYEALALLSPRIQSALSHQVTMDEVGEAIVKFSHPPSITPEAFGTELHRDDTDDTMTFTETEDQEGLDSTSSDPSQGLKGLLYHIAEADAKRKAYEHRGTYCNGCGERPIKGVRWRCLNCPDFDLCSTCEAHTEHQKTHVFAKIKIPLSVLSQPTKEYTLWYPGDPRKSHPPLTSALKQKLGDEYNFDGPHMDAHYDQFVSIANVQWQNCPNRVYAAIDRRAFNKALTCERWPARFQPSVLYDRMFAFYDTNRDGLIGFEEFLSGLAYLRGPKRFASLHRALQGFDIGGDGFINRNDFHRLFRAKHEIQQLLVESMIQGREDELTQAAMDTLRSSLPISSIFSAEEIPLGQERRPVGKEEDQFKDMQPLPGSNVILDDNEGWPNVQSRSLFSNDLAGDLLRPLEREHHISRFEEMLGNVDDLSLPQQDLDNDLSDDGLEQINTRIESETLPNGSTHSAIKPNHSKTLPDERPLDRDVLWQIVEESLWELLDPLFLDKEIRDNEVVSTREERQKWRKEIEEAALAKAAMDDKLISAPFSDPLMATAADSIKRSNSERLHRHGPQIDRSFATEIRPTDPLSLERHEIEIAEQPLEALLDQAGYSVADDASPHNGDSVAFPSSDNSERAAAASENTEESKPLDENPDGTGDAAVPKNQSQTSHSTENGSNPDEMTSTSFGKAEKPLTSINGEQPQPEECNSTTSPEELPSKERLEYLAALEKEDRELKGRGGPGKLSYEEIEVQANSNKELKGLVTSWLEWASF